MIGQIDLAEANTARFDLSGDAELIEIYADGDTLLATHLLNFDQLRNGEQTHTIVLEGRQRITLNLVPFLDEFGEVADVRFTVEYTETAWQRRLASALQRTKAFAANSFGQPILRPAVTFGLVLLALTAGWLVLRNSGERKDLIADDTTPQNQNREADSFQHPLQQENVEIAANKTPSNGANGLDRSWPRQNEMATNQNPQRKIGPEHAPRKVISVEPPREERATNDNVRGNETDDNGVLRLPMRESNQKNPANRYETFMI